MSNGTISVPTCPDCQSSMVLRTARKGRNAGGQFWGCSNYPRCKGIVNLDGPMRGPRSPRLTSGDALSGNNASRSEGNRSQGFHNRKVDWRDASLNRQGWICRYTLGGGRLRSIDLPEEFADRVRACWIGREDLPSFEPVDIKTRRVMGIVRKIIQRGSAPPVHPSVERSILNVAGLSEHIRDSLFEGDLAVELEPAHQFPHAFGKAPWIRPAMFDEGIRLDSDEESIFIRWVANNLGDSALPWLIPQAPLDAIARSRGLNPNGLMRVDFLLHAPWLDQVIIEIDGPQHADAQSVDAERDFLARQLGIDVIRIPSDEVRAGAGPNLSELANRWRAGEATDATHAQLVLLPAQVHRAVLGLIEGVEAGFLSGDRWVIDLEDSTEHVQNLLGPYLSLMAAVDELWGRSEVTPDTVIFKREGRVVTYAREGLEFKLLDGGDGETDMELSLQSDLSPVAPLQSGNGKVPRVVIRGAFLPSEIFDIRSEGTQRVSPENLGASSEEALRNILQTIFAKNDFREGQLAAVREILSGRDCTVLLPTGAGKSLIYQLAGLCLPGRTIVIDPLVALIEDQLLGMELHGIDRVTAITSETIQQGRGADAHEEIARGDALFILIAPERLQRPNFRQALTELAASSPINLAVVDEAHCVSDWGHDFRPSYLLLGDVLREHCGHTATNPLPFLALTGTASRAVLKDVLVQLRMSQRTENSIVKPITFDRSELNFDLVRTNPTGSFASLNGVLNGLPSQFNESTATFYEPRGRQTRSGIIFCPTVGGTRGTTRVAEEVTRSIGHQPVTYSGTPPKGLDKATWVSRKRLNADQFKKNQTSVLVATNAFGMGIDKSNIRWVVHFGIPGSIEAYYQEAGRAGRDRRRATCSLVLTEFDYQRDLRMLGDDAPLEEARRHHGETSWSDGDDITTGLYFHLSSFRGTTAELDDLDYLAKLLEPEEVARTVSISIGERPRSWGKERGDIQQALGRMIRLGVVRDYTIPTQSEFNVVVEGCSPQRIVFMLLDYIERSQAGRSRAVEEALGAGEPATTLFETIHRCGNQLINFVYETIERSRRRSLREMWLAAREAPDGEDFRQRILDYLTEGDTTPVLEALAGTPKFEWADWLSALDTILGPQDAQEWRGTSARLLTSDPDHTGLLLVRGLCELEEVEPNLDEVSANVESAFRLAPTRFGLGPDELASIGRDVCNWALQRSHEGLATVVGSLSRVGLPDAAWAGALEQAVVEGTTSTDVMVISMGLKLRGLVDNLEIFSGVNQEDPNYGN